MRNSLITRLMSAALLLAVAPLSAAHADEMNSTLYLESSEGLNLYLPAILKNGDRALAPRLELPEESIIALDVRHANQALTASKDTPDRVNFPFVTSVDDTRIQRNGKGWVCGVRVVDVNDEDLRESEVIDRNDFCISLEDIHRVKAMDTNTQVVKQSFDDYTEKNDLTYMNALAGHLEATEKNRLEYGVLDLIAAGPTLISPIKDCGKGCLHATSEFGMRNHPVLKKKRLHKGVDLRAKIGTPVVSVLDGKILANRTEKSVRKNKKGKKVETIKGYGHYVIVVHADAKLETLYAHLSGFKKKSGDKVKQGELIALSGNTGIGTAPHLHFETHTPAKKGFAPTNPRTLIGAMLSSVAWVFELFNLQA